MSLHAFTDEDLFTTTGIRIAFTERSGGVSGGDYGSLNLGSNTEDEDDLVQRNRHILAHAFSVEDIPCISPKQVHGDTILVVTQEASEGSEAFQRKAQKGVDGLVVEASEVSALLCFADCVPVIIVSSTKRFAVVHAGWRGVMNGVAIKALHLLRQSDDADQETIGIPEYNVYIGPYIHAECFETGNDLADQFKEAFGPACVLQQGYVDLGYALRTAFLEAGIKKERIADVDVCTVCNNDRFFSYRAQEGTCGRHGAFAVRM